MRRFVSREVPLIDAERGQVAVAGLFGPAGTLHPPEARFCRSTGVRLGIHGTLRLESGERPTVAVVVCDDGSSRCIDDDLAIGRSADNDLILREREHSVSAHHALLRCVGWDLTIADLGSTNGTWRATAGRPTTWERLAPLVAHPVATGDRFVFGRRSCTVRLLR